MTPITTITSVAAPLPQADVDTDMILPAQFLLRLDKNLGPFVFYSVRQPKPGRAPFVLDQDTFKDAQILVAGPRFGIGSSREQAVWAMKDAGLRCVIAPSFGEIFYGNCRRNGILAITLTGQDYSAVLAAAEAGERVCVDLEAQTLSYPKGATISFDIEPAFKSALLSGLDETDAIIKHHGDAITAFEQRQAQSAPWLDLSPQQSGMFAREKTSREDAA